MTEQQQMKVSLPELKNMMQLENKKLQDIDARMKQTQQDVGDSGSAADALTEIKKKGKGSEMLVPLGFGVYINATIADSTTVKESLTWNVLREGKTEDIIKHLNGKKEIAQSNLKKLTETRAEIIKNLKGMDKIMRIASRKAQELKK